MGPRELALRYLDIFFSGDGVEGMLELFHPSDFRFSGPLFAFDSAAEYVQSLQDDPPLDCSYEPISVLEGGDEVCVVYDFVRGDLRTPMAQLFRVRDGHIHRVMLIFDSAPFAAPAPLL